jgi:hypothetical protein
VQRVVRIGVDSILTETLESLNDVDMHLMEAIPVLIPRVLPARMANGAVLIAPLTQARIDVILVGVHMAARIDRGPYQRLKGRLRDILPPSPWPSP